MKSRALRKRNRKMEMRRKFDTEEMQVLVEELSHTGSAFGMNEEGDGVFFNARLVDRMDLETGDEVIAHCVPNYEDKVDEIPWRCIRVSNRIPAGFIHAMEREARKDAREKE
jgi:hypothetical protein